MSRNMRGGGAVEEQSVEQVVEQVTPVSVAIFHSFHPKVGTPDRVSYKIPGVKGAIYMFLSLFKDGIAPQTLPVSANFADPTPDKSAEKATAAALKAQEKADKAQKRLAEQQAKAEAAAVKAQASLDAAKAKAESTESTEESA